MTKHKKFQWKRLVIEFLLVSMFGFGFFIYKDHAKQWTLTIHVLFLYIHFHIIRPSKNENHFGFLDKPPVKIPRLIEV